MRRILPGILIAAFLAMTIAGAATGSFAPIYRKAKQVCRECIGIG